MKQMIKKIKIFLCLGIISMYLTACSTTSAESETVPLTKVTTAPLDVLQPAAMIQLLDTTVPAVNDTSPSRLTETQKPSMVSTVTLLATAKPNPPTFTGKAYVLIDANTGKTLAS
jgi:D-alanyl-D-alanine carboxypeptidase